MKYLGVIDPNDIVRGKIKAEPGDTFTSESIDNMGVIACQYVPGFKKEVGPARGWNNFKVLFKGLRTTCIDVATQTAVQATCSQNPET